MLQKVENNVIIKLAKYKLIKKGFDAIIYRGYYAHFLKNFAQERFAKNAGSTLE